MQVQNKVQQAESRLPSEVQQSGVTVEKSQSSFLLILAVYDKTNRATSSDISDWLVSNMQDPLARVEGVGSLQVFGAEYADARLDGPDQTRLLLADAFRRSVGD
ncbi:RND efflux system, inner membrane transporter CmeB [Klebsiella aerogenes]|nr:RND efflux system, inner membrane transporter CmeB [Klebsiella aerogenes]